MLLQMVLCIFNKHGQAELAAGERGEGELAAARASGRPPCPQGLGKGAWLAVGPVGAVGGWREGPWGHQPLPQPPGG